MEDPQTPSSVLAQASNPDGPVSTSTAVPTADGAVSHMEPEDFLDFLWPDAQPDGEGYVLESVPIGDVVGLPPDAVHLPPSLVCGVPRKGSVDAVGSEGHTSGTTRSRPASPVPVRMATAVLRTFVPKPTRRRAFWTWASRQRPSPQEGQDDSLAPPHTTNPAPESADSTDARERLYSSAPSTVTSPRRKRHKTKAERLNASGPVPLRAVPEEKEYRSRGRCVDRIDRNPLSPANVRLDLRDLPLWALCQRGHRSHAQEVQWEAEPRMYRVTLAGVDKHGVVTIRLDDSGLGSPPCDGYSAFDPEEGVYWRISKKSASQGLPPTDCMRVVLVDHIRSGSAM